MIGVKLTDKGREVAKALGSKPNHLLLRLFWQGSTTDIERTKRLAP